VNTSPQVPCDHSGHHSPQGRYQHDSREIRYVVVCDGCGSEVNEVLREPYTPAFDPAGNDPYLKAAAA
jgi:hypothetical protein